MSLKVGIDFGTSNSGVAVSDGERVRVLPVDPKNLIPEVVKSILYVTRDDQATIGQEAVELYYKHNVGRARRFVKKRAGEIEFTGGEMYYVTDVYVYEDELQPGRLLQFLKTALRSDHFDGTQIFDRFYTPVDIATLYLRELKKRAEKLLGEPVDGATLGRPVRFATDPARDRRAEGMLRQAAEEAGFKTVDFELEPMAAAMYYELSLEKPQTALVFDFGGGTLDLTILRLGDPRRREVFASNGVDIAGSDFDRVIIEKRMLPYFGQGQVLGEPHISEIIDAVPDWMALPNLSSPINRRRIETAILQGVAPARLKTLETLVFKDQAFSFYNAIEAAKITLSDQGVALLDLQDKGLDIWEMYTRVEFEADIQAYCDQVEALLLETVASAGLEPGQIDAVVKTGGSSNIPLFAGMLERVFGAERVKSTNAFSSVTAGLGLRAARGGGFS